MDDELINRAKEVQAIAEEQAKKEGKAYIGSLPNCEIMVMVLTSYRNKRYFQYYLNGKMTHKKRVQKLIVKLLTLKKKAFDIN